MLSIFYRGIALSYQMALNAASDGNFQIRSPKEADRLIEDLTACSNRTDFKRRETAAALWGEEMDAVEVKMDSVYKLLTNQNSLGRNGGT